MTGPPLPADDRPVDPSPVHTVDLPDTPVRDRNIPATAWVEAPRDLLDAGDGLGDPTASPTAPTAPTAMYKRRIGRWLLWRAGPARRAHACYVAVDATDLESVHTFRLHPDGTGEGVGPSGAHHDRFRTWKEDLRDH